MQDCISAVIRIHIHSKKLEHVIKKIATMENIIDIYEVTGECDILLLRELVPSQNLENSSKIDFVKLME